MKTASLTLLLALSCGCAGIPTTVKSDINKNADVVYIKLYDAAGKTEVKSLAYKQTKDIERATGFISGIPTNIIKCHFDGRVVFVESGKNRIIFEARYCLDQQVAVTSDGTEVASRKLSKDGIAFLAKLSGKKPGTEPVPEKETAF